MPRPPVTNGHTKLVALPQRVHSIIVNYVSHISYLQDCHEFWDKADGIVHTSPGECELVHVCNVDLLVTAR